MVLSKLSSFKKGLFFCLIIVFAFQMTGCAHMLTAIEHSSLQTKVKMTDTIFIDPVKLAKAKTVFVSVRNTSEMQEIDFGNMLKQKFMAKGYTITDNPDEADYIVIANVLYMDYSKQTGTYEFGSVGATAGALAGGFLGRGSSTSNLTGSIAGGIAGGLIGGLGGALIGSAIKVETYAGIVDVEIREMADNAVTGKLVTNATQGSATTLQTEQKVETNYQTYRTKIIATAQKTNLDRTEAAQEISDKISTQIVGMFNK